jgi:hypothetical protein
MLFQLFIVGVVSMTGFAILRVIRVRGGHDPLPEGLGRTAIILGFLFIPPLVLGAVLQPPPGGAPLGGIFWVPVYALVLGLLKVLMVLAAALVEGVAKGHTRQVLLIALLGNEGDVDRIAFNPPVTARLAERMALVDRTNAAFPRGVEFPAQVDRSDFVSAWDALDGATRSLEEQIAGDRKLGLGVASDATRTANDARARLLVLRGIADTRGLAASA